MSNPAEIHREAATITAQAERGRPSDLQAVNSELHRDLGTMSAKEYGSLLNGIQKQNGADLQANSHLPKLEFSDEHKSGVPDSVSAHYSDGSVMTAKGDAQTSVNPQAAEGKPGGDQQTAAHSPAAGGGTGGDALGTAGAHAGGADASSGSWPGADRPPTSPTAPSSDGANLPRPSSSPPPGDAPIAQPAPPPTGSPMNSSDTNSGGHGALRTPS